MIRNYGSGNSNAQMLQLQSQIKQLQTSVGDLSKLQTQNKSSLPDAINEHDNELSVLNNASINMEFFPVQIPEVDDSQRFTRALNSLGSNGGTIIFQQGKTYTGTFTVNKGKVRLTGGGTLKGQLNLYGKPTPNMSRFDPSSTGDIQIDNLIFDGERTRDAIHLQWVYGVTIVNNTFKQCLKTVYFEQIPYGQHCSRITISENRLWDCNYGLYVDYVPTNSGELPFVVGDITYTDNVHEARYGTWAGYAFGNIYHIWAKGIDGLVCKGNTFFFGHLGTEVSNIYIELFNWVIIEGNQLFEPTQHGVHAVNGSNLTIANNNVAWSGTQSFYLSNITMGSVNGNNISFKDDNSVITGKTGVYVENSPYFIGTINDNTFYFPNEYAIQIKDSGNITVNGNTSRNKYSTNEPVNINTPATCSNINITGNTFTGYSKTLESALVSLGTNATISFIGNNEGKGVINRSVHSPMYKSYSSNQTTIDISSANLIVFGNSSATTITSITSEDLNNTFPRTVTLFSYNSNTSLSLSIPNTTIKAAPNGVSVTIPAGESITFLIYGGAIKELSRSFPIDNRVRTISDTSTTADMGSYDQLNVNQPSTTTITAITGSTFEGKVIMVFAFNGNTTLSTSFANLKGAINVTLPNKGVMMFKYTAGAWYEVSRNF